MRLCGDCCRKVGNTEVSGHESSGLPVIRPFGGIRRGQSRNCFSLEPLKRQVRRQRVAHDSCCQSAHLHKLTIRTEVVPVLSTKWTSFNDECISIDANNPPFLVHWLAIRLTHLYKISTWVHHARVVKHRAVIECDQVSNPDTVLVSFKFK